MNLLKAGLDWIGSKFLPGKPTSVKSASDGKELTEEERAAIDAENAKVLSSPEYHEKIEEGKKRNSYAHTPKVIKSASDGHQLMPTEIAAINKANAEAMTTGSAYHRLIEDDPVKLGDVPPGKAEPETESTASEVADATGEDPEVIQDSITQATKSPEGRYKVGSIMDAYRNGQLTKDERNYFLVDALATFGSNMADQFGKYASAYSGGSYTPENKSSQWQNRNEALTERGIQSEVNQAGSEDAFDLDYMGKKLGVDSRRFSNETQRINNLNLSDKRIMAKQILNDYKQNKKLTTAEKVRLAAVYNSLLGSGQVSTQDTLLMQAGEILHGLGF